MRLLTLFLSLLAPAQAQSLRGTVTDPSGAVIEGALIQLRGPSPDLRAKTDRTGQYSFPVLSPGKYQIRITAKGFVTRTEKGLHHRRAPNP